MTSELLHPLCKQRRGNQEICLLKITLASIFSQPVPPTSSQRNGNGCTFKNLLPFEGRCLTQQVLLEASPVIWPQGEKILFLLKKPFCRGWSQSAAGQAFALQTAQETPGTPSGPPDRQLGVTSAHKVSLHPEHLGMPSKKHPPKSWMGEVQTCGEKQKVES